jgi:hypothetical protein
VFPEAVLDVLGGPLAGRRVKRRVWRFAEALDGWPGAAAPAFYLDLRGRVHVLVDEELAPGPGLHRVRLLELLDAGAREAGSTAARGRLYVCDGDLASDPAAGREARAKAERHARVACALRGTALAFYVSPKSGRASVLLDTPGRVSGTRSP